MDNLKIYNTLDSTNKEAHRLLAQGPVENGLTLLARYQSDGKGQHGRSWVSQPDIHLAMTIIFQPQKMSPTELPTLGMKVSLGIVQALKNLDPHLLPFIKWPNDIYVDGKKLSGILIENSLSGSSIQHSIIGIGMNINESSFPPEIPNATSLLLITRQVYDIVNVAELVRHHVLSDLQTPSSNWKATYDEYIFGKEKRHLFESGNNRFYASVESVSLEGAIELRLENGETRSFLSHEVKWIV
jgi:BirA family biotin operon repressor/biotin-[acetyl-CoA-carboxylase] ligase